MGSTSHAFEPLELSPSQMSSTISVADPIKRTFLSGAFELMEERAVWRFAYLK